MKQHSAGERGGRRDRGWHRRAACQPAHEVVARREENRRDEGEARSRGGARAPAVPGPARARRRPPTIRTAPTISGQRTGSPRKTSAIVTDASGAEPRTTEARDAPASRIARVTSSWPTPGCIRPASRNGQAAPACTPRDGASATAATSATASAPPTVAIVATSTSGYRFRPEAEPDAHRAEEECGQRREPDRRQRSARSAAASQRRRMSPEHGPTASQ